MALNWNLLNAPNPGDAFNEAFNQARQSNAIRALMGDPSNTNALADLTSINPQAGFAFQRMAADRAAQEQAAQERQLTAAALRGNDGARDQLAGLNPELWMKLDKRQQDEVSERVKAIGEAALIADTPQKWDTLIERLSVRWPDLAQYRGKFSPEARQAAIAEAGKASEFLDQMKTDWRVVPQGGYLQGFDQMGRPIGPVQDSPASQGAPSAPAGGAQGAFRVVGLPGDQETSGRRSAADNRRVDGVPNSFHLSGQASDRVPPPGMSMAAYAAELQRLNPNLEVINEGDHVHLEPRSRDQFAQGGGANREQLVAQARDAIARGADPAAVQARLNQLLGGN